eukprot:384291_1
MSWITTFKKAICPYSDLEKENNSRHTRHMIKLALSISVLSIIIMLLIYLCEYEPTHSIHNTMAMEQESNMNDETNETNETHEVIESNVFVKSKYKTDVQSPVYHNANDLNKDLFCSFKTDNNGNIENKLYSIFMSDVLRLQYPTNCDGENNQYLVLNQTCNVGLFASMQCFSYYLLMSINLNRTLIITGQIQKFMDAYFIPISNCSVSDILYDYSKQNQSVFELTQKNIFNRQKTLGINLELWKNDNAVESVINRLNLSERILLMPSKESGINGFRWIKQDSMGKAFANSYVLRMRKSVKNKVYDIVNKTLYSSNNFNYNHSLSMILDWSYYCTKYKVDYDNWTCFIYDKYIDAIKNTKEFKGNFLKHIILVSDKLEIIEKIERNNNEWMRVHNISFISKIGSIMYGYVEQYLVTIQLLFASKYHLISIMQHWELELFKMKIVLNCTVFNIQNQITDGTQVYVAKDSMKKRPLMEVKFMN